MSSSTINRYNHVSHHSDEPRYNDTKEEGSYEQKFTAFIRDSRPQKDNYSPESQKTSRKYHQSSENLHSYNSRVSRAKNSVFDQRTERDTKYDRDIKPRNNIQINKEITNLSTIAQIIDCCKDHLHAFDHINIATALHRIASSSKKNGCTARQKDFVSKSLAQEASNKVTKFKSREIANTAWAFATLGIKDEALFKKLAQAAINKINEFNSQDIANTAWAFATLGIKDEALFKKLAQSAINKINDFNSQEIANTAWAFATLGIRDEALFKKLAQTTINKSKECNSQQIANTAWAFATLGIKDEALFKKLAQSAINKIKEFNSQEIANTAWAFATLAIRDEALFEKLAQSAINKIKEFNSQNIVNTAWAFATLGIRDEALFKKLAQTAINKIKECNSQGIANTAWAFATLGIRDEALFKKLAQSAINKIKEFNSQDIANTAWAFAVVNLLNLELCRLLFLFSSLLEAHKYSDKELRQLKYVNLHIEFEKEKNFPRLPQNLLKTVSSLQLKEARSSKLHQEVSSHLTKMGLQFTNETSINDLIVDICLPEKRLIIEVDGPSHFADRSHTPLGHTLFKRRLLEAMDWKVLSIPHWQWDKLGDNSNAKIEYLKSTIKDKV